MSRGNPFHSAAVVLFAVAVHLSGCFPKDMADQPRVEPHEKTEFPNFEHSMGSRPLVEGVVSRGNLRTDEHYYNGTVDGELATEFPERLSEEFTPEELLVRGEEQYKIYCSHCHGLIGGGTGGAPEMLSMVGMAVKRGFPMPPTYHSDRVRAQSVGHFYDVITNGYGKMKSHADLVKVENRWAIVAWIRTLQLSQAPDAIVESGD